MVLNGIDEEMLAVISQQQDGVDRGEKTRLYRDRGNLIRATVENDRNKL